MEELFSLLQKLGFKRISKFPSNIIFCKTCHGYILKTNKTRFSNETTSNYFTLTRLSTCNAVFLGDFFPSQYTDL